MFRYSALAIHRALLFFLFSFALITNQSLQAQDLVALESEFRQWHRVTIMVTCPQSDCGDVTENSEPNPFTAYRLLVTFTSPDGTETFQVPGFYAGDGNAHITETDSGNVWMAYFTPNAVGDWQYNVLFETGDDIVLNKDAGTPIGAHGTSGTISITTSDKSGSDFRGRGFLRSINSNYYYFSGTNKPFLKNGTGSPENILHYHEFHNTYQADSTKPVPAHEFPIHVADFNEGDPLWGPTQSQGKAVIGALNYLSSLGVNSYYFIINNTALNDQGQGTGVWPWISPDSTMRDRFSVAKLAQWEVLFTHMDSLGISMNMVTQDRINQWDIDGGELGRVRKILYRELVARFGHHLAVVWNLGEENSATEEQIKDYANFFREWDAYEHPIVSQANGTLSAHDRYYTPLLGFDNFDGASLQVGLNDLDSSDPPSPSGKIHNAVLKWVQESQNAGRAWAVMLDEIGHWSDGIVPDGDARDPTNRRARREGFWGTLLAGGAGADWYYGSDPFEYNDIWTEDFTKREAFFQRTQNGINMILENELPYWEMVNQNEISSREDTWVFGKSGESYMVYSPYLDDFVMKLPFGEYDIMWYDAFAGGPLQEGTVTEVNITNEAGWVSIGLPIDFEEDGLAVVTRKPSTISEETELVANEQAVILKQNYPNPVRTTTTIPFELSQPAQVELSIYDVLGRRVKTIENAFLSQGSQRYEVNLSDLPGGVYVYRLKVGDAEYLEGFMLRL